MTNATTPWIEGRAKSAALAWAAGEEVFAREVLAGAWDHRADVARAIEAAENDLLGQALGELDVRVSDLVMLRKAIEAGDPKAELLIRVDDMLREIRAVLAKAGRPVA